MTGIAAPLGLLACLSMTVSALGATGSTRHDAICYGGRDVPEVPADTPKACHAVMSCATHRKPRTFP